MFAKNRPEVLVEARGRMGKGLGDGLLQADHADDQGDAAYLVAAQLEGLVGGVVGNDEDGIVRGAAADALDERALVGVDNIDLVPLEKRLEAGTLLQATMSPEEYLGYIDEPLTGMRKSAPWNAGTTYRSHSYSSTETSPDSAPAMAETGKSGIPWPPIGDGVASGISLGCGMFEVVMGPFPVRSQTGDISGYLDIIFSKTFDPRADSFCLPLKFAYETPKSPKNFS